MVDKCVSCGNSILAADGYSKFVCPNCGETTIVRCNVCRAKSVEYVCPNCGFRGP